jgi:NTE family protein
LLAATLLFGCAPFLASNQPLARWDPTQGYRPIVLRKERSVGDAIVLLAFSGGGTRASALAYGVLEELRDTKLPDGRRLLDEVDAITSVSGGSFTSAYYGLHGDGIFVDFEERMLRNNLQGALIRALLNPLNWFRLIGSVFDRSELAARLYDREVFDGATYADMLAAGGPLIQINATDLAAGSFFTFFQPQFDLICSDLLPFSVARAVTASSAVPGAFSPIPLRNYAGSCGFEPPPWFEEALAVGRKDPRRFRAARIAHTYLDATRRPYIHLLDGGISDNIGLRVPLQNVSLTGGPVARFEALDIRELRHVAVIVVNAEVNREATFSLTAATPGLRAIFGSISNTQIYSFNFDTIELMRESLARWSNELPKTPEGDPVGTSMVLVEFDEIEDPAERDFFNSVPTALALPDRTVDRLIAVGRKLLRESDDYQALVRELGGTLEAKP